MVVRHLVVLALTLSMFCALPLARAQQRPAAKPAGKGQETPKAPEKGEAPPQIAAASAFLRAWGRGEWEELAKWTEGPTVALKVAGKEATIDLQAKKAGALLVLPFSGLSTNRKGGEVESVSVGSITVRVDKAETKGKGTLTLVKVGDAYKISAVKVEGP